MAGKQYEIAIALAAKGTAQFGKAFKAASQSMSAVSKAANEMAKNSKVFDQWRSAGEKVRATSKTLDEAKARLAALGKALHSTQTPTKAMTSEFEQARAKVQSLSSTLETQRSKFHTLADTLRQAGVNTKTFTSEQAKLQKQLEKSAQLSDRLQKANEKIAYHKGKRGEILNDAFGAAGQYMPALGAAGAGAFIASSVKLSAEYEKALNKTTAIGGLDQDSRKKLDTLFRDLGASTEYTATEAANTGTALTRAGFTSDEIVAALPALLNAATANDMGLEETASSMADILRAYSMSASEMGTVSDIITKSANIANLGVHEMGETFKYAAPNAAALGVSMQDLAAMTGVLADNGIKGSQAGTTMRTVLNKMVDDKSLAILGKLGISTKDTNGQLRNMFDIFGDLQTRLSKKSEVDRAAILKNIFGTEAMTGAQILTGNLSSLDAKRAQIAAAQGSTAQSAATMRGGVLGAWNQLQSAIQGVSLNLVTDETGAKMEQLILSLTDKFQGLAKWIAENSDLITKLTEVAGYFVEYKFFTGAIKLGVNEIGLWTGYAQKAWTVAQQMYTAYQTLGGAAKLMTAAQAALNAVMAANPIGLAVAAAAALVAVGVALYKNWDTVKASMQALGAWISEKWDVVTQPIRDFMGWLAGIWDSICQKIEGFKSVMSNLNPANWFGGNKEQTAASAAAWDAAMLDQTRVFGAGGIVNGATPAIVGESGAEAIIPLNGTPRAHSLLDTANAIMGRSSSSNNVSINYSPSISINGTSGTSDLSAVLRDNLDDLVDRLRSELGITNPRLSYS